MSDEAFQIFHIESHWLLEEEKRIDASFYTKDAVAARVLIGEIEKRGIEVRKMGFLSNDIFWPGRFKRKYAHKKDGSPFLMPSEVIMFFPKAKKFIKNYPKNVKVKEKWLLITRSGSVGRVLICNKLLENSVLSDDLIRVIPRNEERVAYLYAYLNTWIGRAFLTKDRYGATVKHIEPHHASAIPIPVIRKLEEIVTPSIFEAHKLREDAQELILKAERILFSELGLSEIDEEYVKYFGGDDGRIIKSFGVKASELKLRLDASYHLPILKQIVANLTESKFEVTTLGRLANKIFIPTRFKRPYVSDPSMGVPFLQGSHVPQIKPLNVKYLWNKTKNLEHKLIQKNWVLMTRSGTVGRIGIVREGWKDWAASEHVLRIVIKPEVHPGYIAAFLTSPYGEHQIKGKIYGAVVDEIGEQDTTLIEEINVILPPRNIQDEIGNLVFEAYDKRDKANKIDQEAVELFEKSLKEIVES